jgi:hypothetical protein
MMPKMTISHSNFYYGHVNNSGDEGAMAASNFEGELPRSIY